MLIAAIVTGMTAITTAQIVNAQGNSDGKGKSDESFGNEYIKENSDCGRDGDCQSGGDDVDKNWGKSISEGADNVPETKKRSQWNGRF